MICTQYKWPVFFRAKKDYQVHWDLLRHRVEEEVLDGQRVVQLQVLTTYLADGIKNTPHDRVNSRLLQLASSLLGNAEINDQ